MSCVVVRLVLFVPLVCGRKFEPVYSFVISPYMIKGKPVTRAKLK